MLPQARIGRVVAWLPRSTARKLDRAGDTVLFALAVATPLLGSLLTVALFAATFDLPWFVMGSPYVGVFLSLSS